MCDFCDGQCSCHINPPCSFCEGHVECELCGKKVCVDKAEEVMNKLDGSKILLCPICFDAEVD